MCLPICPPPTPSYGLFEVAPGSGLAFPSPTAEALPQGLALLEFTGGAQCRVR